MGKKKTKSGKKTSKKGRFVEVPIKFNISDTIITRYATNMIVQTVENEFKISFFEQKPEIHFEPIQKPPNEIQADCVASVIVTADRMPRFINALQIQFERYISQPPKIKK